MSTEWMEKIPKGSIVRKAYEFAEEAHAKEKRLDGEPYFSHCEAVAKMVLDWNLGEAAVAAALLHDVVENTSYSLKDIEKNFGAEITFLVNGLTKLKSVSYPQNADT